MKPILFNTDMVRALLADRKTVTRQVVKLPLRSECDHGGQHEFIRDDFIEGTDFTGFVCKKCGYGVCGPHFKFPVGSSWIRPPYRPGDVLYVRETWCDIWSKDGTWIGYEYRANGEPNTDYWGVFSGGCPIKSFKWRPSIHMPREAARIFLRVTDVRVERLQDMTAEDSLKEGVKLSAKGCVAGERPLDPFAHVWNKCYAKPHAVRAKNGDVDHYESYPWEDIHETRTYKGKPWYVMGNPWVWVIEFERCDDPDAVKLLGGEVPLGG